MDPTFRVQGSGSRAWVIYVDALAYVLARGGPVPTRSSHRSKLNPEPYMSGAQVDIVDPTGDTPLHWAVEIPTP